MKRFLLIDDHVVVRSGIKMLLEDLYPGSVTHEAANGAEAEERIRHEEYDLVMLDIQMPGTDALQLMEELRFTYSGLKVLIFSMNPENIYALRFIRAGARGFLSKDAPLDDMKRAIDMVLNNKKFLSDEMLSMLAEGTAGTADENPFNSLSAREFEIVTMLLEGKTISGIAAQLNLGISTIGTHKARIFGKLRVNNLLELKELATSFRFKA